MLSCLSSSTSGGMPFSSAITFWLFSFSAESAATAPAAHFLVSLDLLDIMETRGRTAPASTIVSCVLGF